MFAIKEFFVKGKEFRASYLEGDSENYKVISSEKGVIALLWEGDTCTTDYHLSSVVDITLLNNIMEMSTLKEDV